MFGLFRKPEMITADEALPGRDEPLQISGVHRVLGTDMRDLPDDVEVLYVAMGCFWGAERFFWQQAGVHTTAVGYVHGFTPNPTYEESCTGMTASTEGVLVAYRPDEVDLELLLKLFWENHDPTTPNRQGNDVGTQYRSGIYWTTPEQETVVRASAARYQRALDDAGHGEIATELAAYEPDTARRFYYAEEHHQQYLHKNPNGYCNHGFCQAPYDAEAHGQGGEARATLPDA